MSRVIDARGLSCPQPVLMTLEGIKEQGEGEMEILVDNETSRENVKRAADSKGWRVKDDGEQEGGFRIIIEKG